MSNLSDLPIPKDIYDILRDKDKWSDKIIECPVCAKCGKNIGDDVPLMFFSSDKKHVIYFHVECVFRDFKKI